MNSSQPTKEDEAAKIVPGLEARPKPKRPLSAFNLFYRFKRQKVLKALAAGAADKDKICELISAVPGMEHHPPTTGASKIASPEMLEPLRRNTIRKELEQNLEPRDTKTRAHRKNEGAMNGSMSFVEMGKIMNTSWKNCDPFAKSVFNELAEEGRARYRHRTEAYNKSKRQDAYNATGDVNGGQKQHFTSAKMPAKKKSKSAFNATWDVNASQNLNVTHEKKPAKKKLPAKKTISTKASLLLPLKGDAHDYVTAEVMVELATRTPPCNKTIEDMSSMAPSRPHPPSKIDDIVGNKAKTMPTEVSRLHPLSKADLVVDNKEGKIVPKETLNPPSSKAGAIDDNKLEAKMVPKDILRAKPHTISSFNSYQQIRSPPCAPPINYSSNEEMLMLRVRELERQLEEERLRSRIRELEFERTQQSARGDLLRYVYDDVSTTQNRAMPPALLSNNCSYMQYRPQQSLFSTRAIRSSMQAAERAALLSRIAEQQQVLMPSELSFTNRPGSISPRGVDGRPITRQMTGSYFSEKRC